MEKKLIALVFVTLLGGLGGGYGLGYVIYQPQVQSIQNELRAVSNELNSLSSTVYSIGDVVANHQNQRWHKVYFIASSSDVIADEFILKGSSVRVMWIAYGWSENAMLSVRLIFPNGTLFAVWGSSGVYTANNAVLELPQSGSYDLDIASIDTDYQVSVWDYY